MREQRLGGCFISGRLPCTRVSGSESDVAFRCREERTRRLGHRGISCRREIQLHMTDPSAEAKAKRTLYERYLS